MFKGSKLATIWMGYLKELSNQHTSTKEVMSVVGRVQISQYWILGEKNWFVNYLATFEEKMYGYLILLVVIYRSKWILCTLDSLSQPDNVSLWHHIQKRQ